MFEKILEYTDEPNLNDERIVLEFIGVRQTQDYSYLSAEELSEDEVEYIGETKNKEEHPNTISVTKKMKQCSINQFF